jgi:hypothetical protein
MSSTRTSVPARNESESVHLDVPLDAAAVSPSLSYWRRWSPLAGSSRKKVKLLSRLQS